MSDDRQMLTEVATGLFRDRCTPGDVVAAEDTGWSDRLWSALAESGFPYVSVPEEAGGSGGDIADACALLTVAGVSGYRYNEHRRGEEARDQLLVALQITAEDPGRFTTTMNFWGEALRRQSR